MRRFLLSAAAFATVIGIGIASNIPYVTGPLDPAALVGHINSLTQRINFGVSGLNGSLTTSGTTSTTAKTALFNVTLPAGQMDAAGEVFHMHATGVNSADSNAKTLTFDFGAIACALTVTGSSNTWSADFWVTKTGASTQAYNCQGRTGTSSLADVQGTGTVTDTAAINADVSGTAATSGTMTLSQAWMDQNK